MTTNPNRFPILIVSTDPIALRELSWALAGCGFQSNSLSDWGNKAVLQQLSTPSLLLLDARDRDEIEKLLATPRATHYTYRVAFADAPSSTDVEMLLEGGADDILSLPANRGELQVRIEAGLRRLDFESKLARAMPYESQTGLLTRSGFTRRLERKLSLNKGERSGVLVVLSIDLLEVLRREMGNLVAGLSQAALSKCLVEQTINDDFCAQLEDGIFVAFLHQSSLDEGTQFAELVAKEFTAQSVQLPKLGAKTTVSAVVIDAPGPTSAEELVGRGLTAVAHAKCSGGNIILDANELEKAFAAWQQQTTTAALSQSVLAQHVMEPLPLVLPASGVESLDGHGPEILDMESRQSLPPFLAVVDESGSLLGVVEPETFRQHQSEVFENLAEHLVPVTDVVDRKLPLQELESVMSTAEHDYLIVHDNDKPVGYITSQKLAAVSRDLLEQNGDTLESEEQGCLASLVVPTC